MSEEPKESSKTKMIVIIVAGLMLFIFKDLYTRVLDRIQYNHEVIHRLETEIELLKAKP